MSPRLETERLVLRLPRLEDAEAAAEWLERWEANGMGYFALERREEGRFLGRVGINLWHARTWHRTTLAEGGAHAQPELAWTLDRAHRRHGYATEAARAVRDWARAERGVTRLISLIAPDNVASQRVAERLGARPAATVTVLDSDECVVWEHPR